MTKQERYKKHFEDSVTEILKYANIGYCGSILQDLATHFMHKSDGVTVSRSFTDKEIYTILLDIYSLIDDAYTYQRLSQQ